MRIQTRIVGLVLILLTLMLCASLFARKEIAKIGREIVGITEQDIRLSEIITQIATYKLEQAINFERALRFAVQAQPGDESARIPFEEARAEFNRVGELVHQQIQRGEQLARRLERERKTGDAARSVSDRLQRISAVYGEYERHSQAVFELIAADRIREAKLDSLTIVGEEEAIKNALKGLLGFVVSRTQESADRAKFVQENSLRGLLSFSAIALILGILLAVFITRSITRPLAGAVRYANEIAAGNKDVEIETAGAGEVGHLLEAMKEMLDAVNQSELALREQAKELARSNAELEQFAYVASHDLQEPLRMVASYTQLIAKRYRGQLDADADEFINFAVSGVTRMQALINDLLTYSRVGRKQKEFATVDCNVVLERAKANLKFAIDESHAVVSSGELPTVVGDEIQLTQLFQNLIGNAIKFRGVAAPMIHLVGARIDNEWQLSVRDNGIGLDPQFANRIFNIFQRLHSQSEYPGTGIGLAICKKIVERHGGRIWVESEPGQGATFVFTIPDGAGEESV